MSIQLINQRLLLNPPKYTAAVLLLQPYILGCGYLTHAIYPRCEDKPNLNLYKRGLCVLLGANLFLPIVNTIMYVALRILCSYTRQVAETNQTPHASNSKKFDKATYVQNIQDARDKASTAVLKIKDPSIKKDIQDFINEISKTAQQLIETLTDIDLCSSITENLQHELLCIEEQIQYLIDTQEEEPISAPLQSMPIPVDGLNWSQEIFKAMQNKNKNQFETLLKKGKENNFINLKFPRFFNGTLFHQLSKYSRYKDYLASLTFADIDPSLQDNWGNTGLIWAIANACNTNALLILENLGHQGPYLDIQCLIHQNTALHLAIAKGYKDRSAHGELLEISNLELVKTLLNLKANPNLQTKEGYTPLHLACIRRDCAMISALLKAGADPSIKNKAGETPKDLLIINYSKSSEIIENICGVYLLNKEEYEANLEAAQNLL